MKKRILILEDEMLIKKMISESINKHEYEILDVSSFISYSVIGKQFYDLIIVDLTSIRNDKVELLVQLKNNILTSIVPFLLITTKNRNEMEDHFTPLNHYLKKPFSEDVFMEMITKILNHQERTSPW